MQEQTLTGRTIAVPESRELDFELFVDVTELLFNSRENVGSGGRRSRGTAFSALAAFAARALDAFGAARANRLRTHETTIIDHVGRFLI